MEMHEYLEILKAQIRYVKVRDSVAKEVEDHIKDQAMAYRQSGMTVCCGLKYYRSAGPICIWQAAGGAHHVFQTVCVHRNWNSAYGSGVSG